MENLPVRVPHTLFPDLVSAFIPPDTPPDAELELVITIEGENIPAREFAEYLALITGFDLKTKRRKNIGFGQGRDAPMR